MTEADQRVAPFLGRVLDEAGVSVLRGEDQDFPHRGPNVSCGLANARPNADGPLRSPRSQSFGVGLENRCGVRTSP